MPRTVARPYDNASLGDSGGSASNPAGSTHPTASGNPRQNASIANNNLTGPDANLTGPNANMPGPVVTRLEATIVVQDDGQPIRGTLRFQGQARSMETSQEFDIEGQATPRSMSRNMPSSRGRSRGAQQTTNRTRSRSPIGHTTAGAAASTSQPRRSGAATVHTPPLSPHTPPATGATNQRSGFDSQLGQTAVSGRLTQTQGSNGSGGIYFHGEAYPMDHELSRAGDRATQRTSDTSRNGDSPTPPPINIRRRLFTKDTTPSTPGAGSPGSGGSNRGSVSRSGSAGPGSRSRNRSRSPDDGGSPPHTGGSAGSQGSPRHGETPISTATEAPNQDGSRGGRNLADDDVSGSSPAHQAGGSASPATGSEASARPASPESQSSRARGNRAAGSEGSQTPDPSPTQDTPSTADKARNGKRSTPQLSPMSPGPGPAASDGSGSPVSPGSSPGGISPSPAVAGSSHGSGEPGSPTGGGGSPVQNEAVGQGPAARGGPPASYDASMKGLKGRTRRQIRNATGLRVSDSAGAYMAGVLAYLSAEYLTDGRTEARRNGRKIIQPDDLRRGLDEDEEMKTMLKHVTIPRDRKSME